MIKKKRNSALMLKMEAEIREDSWKDNNREVALKGKQREEKMAREGKQIDRG